MLKDKITQVIALMLETEGEVRIFDCTKEEAHIEIAEQGLPLRPDDHGNMVHATHGFVDWISVCVEDGVTVLRWGHH